MAWNTAAIIETVRKTAQQQTEREAERILNASRNLVPLNKDPRMAWHKGTLMRSGEVIAEHKGDLAQAKITYSVDEPYDYARIQHDTLSFAHETGQALYLSEPYDEMKPAAIRNVGAAVKSALRRMP